MPHLPRSRAIGFVRVLLKLFFRRIEVVGRENIPQEGGGIFVAWHPNGLIDPALLIAECPRPIMVGARHGLFSWPLLGPLMRSVGAVPVYRAVDASPAPQSDSTRSDKNRQSLDALATRLSSGELTALFPEGVSHDAPHLVELKTGAAKLFTQALALRKSGDALPAILPVGLHYDEKNVFRSRALVVFHPPLVLSEALTAPLPETADTATRRARYAAITRDIEAELRNVVHATESWELHALMHRIRRLFRAERAKRAGAQLVEPDMQEREAGYARVWAGFEANRHSAPEATAALTARVSTYDKALRALGLDDEDLDRGPTLHGGPIPLIAATQALTMVLFFPPLLLAGFVANVIPYQLIRLISAAGAKLKKDAATVKAVSGAVLFPLSWAAFAALAATGAIALHETYRGFPRTPVAAALFALAFAVCGGALLLRYQEFLGEAWRSLRVRLTRYRYRAEIEKLRDERSGLFDAFSTMVKGVKLPGEVGSDGRVLPTLESSRPKA